LFWDFSNSYLLIIQAIWNCSSRLIESVILVDDCINSGSSIKQALKLLKDANFKVVGVICVVVFEFGIGLKKLEKEIGCWIKCIYSVPSPPSVIPNLSKCPKCQTKLLCPHCNEELPLYVVSSHLNSFL